MEEQKKQISGFYLGQSLTMKKRIFSYLLLFSIFLFSFQNYLYGQQGVSNESRFNNIIPASPDVSQLQKYIDFPVSHNTGIPDISLPLYEINTGNLSLPITLSYHSSGFKVDDQSGIIGLGWSLNAGGMVSRKIVNKPDEFSYYPYPYKNPYLLNQEVESDFFYIGNMPYSSATSGGPDGEYDVFYYSAGSSSGKFFLAGDGNMHRKPVVIPYEPVIITTDCNFNSNTPINYFEITDKKGDRYRYGKSSTDATTAIEVQNEIIGVPSAWFLKEIHSANDTESIKFYYELMNRHTYHRSDVWDFKDYHDNFYSTIGPIETQIEHTDISYWSQKLKKIEFIGGSVDFNYINDVLKSMIVKDMNGNLIKKIVFEQNLFTNQPTGTGTGIDYLKLSSINSEDSNGNKSEKYAFNYNEAVSFPDNYPIHNTTGVDYWGYYNGKSNYSLIPPFTLQSYSGQTYITSYNNREVDDAKMQVFILKKIQFPTGGTTEFEYEANKANSKDVGGLRIKNITTTASLYETPLIKRYKYGLSENGAGKLLKNPYTLNAFMNFSESWIYLSFMSSPPFRSRSISSDMYDGGDFNSGSTVFYEQVTEYQEKQDGTTNGKSIYLYEPPFINNYYIGTNIYTTVYEEWKTNHLISKTDYKRENLSYIPIKKVEYKYNLREDNPLKCSKVMAKQNGFVGDNATSLWSYFSPQGPTAYSLASMFHYGNSIELGYSPDIGYDPAFIQNSAGVAYNIVEYEYKTGAKHLSEVKTTMYMNSGEFVTKENYDYGVFHNDPISKATTNSNYETLTTKYFYPKDPEMASKPNVATLISKNIIGVPLVTQTLKGTEKLFEQETQYGMFGNLLFPQYVYAGKVATTEKKVTFDSYDTTGNITQYTPESGVPVSIIWGYNKTQPIAKIENATNAQISTALSVANLSVLNETNLTAINNLRTNTTLPNIMVSTFTYIPLVGVSTITDPKGDKITYNYDAFGRLQNVKDKDGNILSENEYHYKN